MIHLEMDPNDKVAVRKRKASANRDLALRDGSVITYSGPTQVLLVMLPGLRA